jgi:CRP/FNR family cyclic AMP-dependent transcriptional regulator
MHPAVNAAIVLFRRIIATPETPVCIQPRTPTEVDKNGSTLAALEKIALFDGMSRADLQVLAAVTVVRNYPGHAIIVNEGDQADSLYLIFEGRVKFFVTGDDGRKVVLGTQGAGEYFGEISLNGGVRSASAMTTEPCRIGCLQRAGFLQFLTGHPETALALINHLIRRTLRLTERVRDLALLDVYGRLAKLLLSVAREQDGQLIVEGLTQQEMGERIGASREMVSRILKDLKAGGYVRVESRRLVVLRKPPRGW